MKEKTEVIPDTAVSFAVIKEALAKIACVTMVVPSDDTAAEPPEVDEVTQHYNEDDENYLEYSEFYTTEYIWDLDDEIVYYQTSSSWQDLWVEAHKGTTQVDPLMAASDYYLLFGIINDSFVETVIEALRSDEDIIKAGMTLGLDEDVISKRLEEIAEERLVGPLYLLDEIKKTANEYFINLVEELDPVFREYSHLAVGGEVRHHQSINSHEIFDGCGRREAWGKWYWIFQQYGPEALLHMSKLFREMEGGSIGGEAWAQASDILYKREMGLLGPDEFTNKQLFVDRIFTLEHNNGCFLNKLKWVNLRIHRGGEYNGDLSTMKSSVLKAHCADPPLVHILHGHASNIVRGLLEEYFSLVKSIGFEFTVHWSGNKPVAAAAMEPKSTESSVPMIDWSDVETAGGDDTSWLYEAIDHIPCLDIETESGYVSAEEKAHLDLSSIILDPIWTKQIKSEDITKLYYKGTFK